MLLPRLLPARFARHLLALVAAFAQFVAATGAPLPASPKQSDTRARADLAPADPVGTCGVGACCCAPVNEPACGCCEKPAAEPFVWVGGVFQQKCHDTPIVAGLLKFELLAAAPACAAVSLPVPGCAFARAAAPSLPHTPAEPPVPPPKLSVM